MKHLILLFALAFYSCKKCQQCVDQQRIERFTKTGSGVWSPESDSTSTYRAEKCGADIQAAESNADETKYLTYYGREHKLIIHHNCNCN